MKKKAKNENFRFGGSHIDDLVAHLQIATQIETFNYFDDVHYRFIMQCEQPEDQAHN